MTDVAADFGLKKNPFRTLVTEESTKHWAGMSEIKGMLEDIVRSVQPDDIGQSECVILYGAYGGGKTHALRYFTRKIRKENMGYAFYVGKVRLSAKSTFLVLYKTIINENKTMLLELLEKVIGAVHEEVSIARKSGKYPNLRGDEVYSQQIIDDMASPTSAHLISELFKKYDGLINANENDIAQFLTSASIASDDYSAASALASLIAVMTSPLGNQPAPYDAAYVFLDEVEDLLSMKYADLYVFQGAIRELLNRTADSNCAILLSMTIGTPEELEAQLEPFLIERLTRPHIQMKELQDDDAKIFVTDFLQSARLTNENLSQPFSPFTEEAIDFLLERDPQIVPRRILRNMGSVFERATRREKVLPGEDISREIAEEILNDMGV